MNILRDISLKPFNTFGIDMPAACFVELEDMHQLLELSDTDRPRHILGGGSNILLTAPVTGLVIRNRLTGITQVHEDNDHVWLKVNSGEIWHNFVLFAINENLGGVENLALIPGTVGAAPIQNIGAYGVEAKETIACVTFWHWEDRKFISYNTGQCRFGYRDSIFKHELKDKVFITSVVFKLKKKPVFNTSYGAIEQELQKKGIKELSVKAIAAAVISIRTGKLPDPHIIGNAGSFFKNPTIPVSYYNELKAAHPLIPSYPVSSDLVKVPAGWLIEQCGWKGYRNGDAGVHALQALVLVNYGHAGGNDIWQLSVQIVDSVKNKFGIDLEREVQVW